MERFHSSDIPCTSYTGGAINTENFSSKGGAINTNNLAPHDDTDSYLYPPRLTSYTNAFRFPNQRTPCPNRQGVASLPKSGPHSGSNLTTYCIYSKGDPTSVCQSHFPPHSLLRTYTTPGQ